MEKRTITVRITGYKQDFVKGDQKTFYEIEADCEGNSWEMSKRFNEFNEFNKELAKTFGNLPSFPRKTLFKIKKSSDIEKRKTQLETYLQNLVIRDDMYGNPVFVNFFEVTILITPSSTNISQTLP